MTGGMSENKKKEIKKRERRNKTERKTHLNDQKTRKWNTKSFGIYDKASC